MTASFVYVPAETEEMRAMTGRDLVAGANGKAKAHAAKCQREIVRRATMKEARRAQANRS